MARSPKKTAAKKVEIVEEVIVEETPEIVEEVIVEETPEIVEEVEKVVIQSKDTDSAVEYATKEFKRGVAPRKIIRLAKDKFGTDLVLSGKTFTISK